MTATKRVIFFAFVIFLSPFFVFYKKNHGTIKYRDEKVKISNSSTPKSVTVATIFSLHPSVKLPGMRIHALGGSSFTTRK
jgi:hypothetical protein